MSSKQLKTHTGRIVHMESIRLSNGNLLIPGRHPDDRSQAVWMEVEPGSSDYKRWLPVAVDKPDPREAKS